ncbi:unnamed protein product [Triticum turgidum subsp. durum]|uniref:SBP-type domain-containing protein n=1 Tax=Triticum turgidum subsp. durum TaxID=4567 RepID=A0A9R0ZBM2_TRITD|nr:ideal plant architecture 1-like protein [Triticum aestivum]VAI73961.1 unnamed protein product [Triticum turgidum subsp. durum]
MEIGSGGCGGGDGSGGGGGDDQQRHGLKFGKKIYFEDSTGPGGGSGGVNASSSKPPAGGGRKGKAVAAGGASGSAPPRCQVEGCGVDLSGAKQYHCRHKVCSMHTKEPRVVVAGLEQRFCQQCSRFHQLPEFDQGKRSCRRRLAGHNERRRKAPPGPLATRYGRLAASFEEPGRFRSYLLDFSYPRVPSSVRDAWPGARPGYRMPGEIQWQGNLDLRPHTGAGTGYGHHHAYSSHGGFPGPELPPGGCLAGVAADSSCALSLLSTQPWDNTPHGASHDHRSAGFDGHPVGVSPSIMACNYMPPPASPWGGSRGHEDGRNAPHQQLPHDVQLHEVHHPAGSSQHGHFSGELELALQGNRPAPGPRGGDHGSSGGAFDHPGSSSNWSL